MPGPYASLTVVREERTQELVESGRVAACDDARRHRGHGRRSRDVHGERDFAEELSRPEDPAVAERRLGHGCEPREDDEEPIAWLTLADEHGSGGHFVPLHPVRELCQRLAGERREEPHTRELGHRGGDMSRRHVGTVPTWAS